MEFLSQFTPREAGVLNQEPEVSFHENDLAAGATDRCPITYCDYTCMGTGNTG
ncbi:MULTISPECIES: hypothetical protein [Streptomyces]|uniref:Uncharacterized protein n=1 Tax=Streptomyces spirodelae TaxID=2812904 RepID=A0ABS3WRB2_9ACTN|nr:MULTISPECIES: hypothetical protein [Streptomyces]MBO8185654.1 hypothetical protein [Streptomyces spirodelae]UNZ20241.1 hypothetical protein HC362_27485 [Streptomyces sp. 891-h]